MGLKHIPYAMVMILLTAVVIAPPNPHGVRGNVYYPDGSYYTASAIPIRINDSTSGEIVYTQTNGGGPDHIFSAYSTSITGEDNDPITVLGWNATHYGIVNTLLAHTTTYADITLNLTRPSETNVTITAPANNSIYNTSETFLVQIKVEVFGGQDGTDCQATVSFSNSTVLTLTQGETQSINLGFIGLGSSTTTEWNITTNQTGSADISVISSCTSDGINFEGKNSANVSGITVIDQVHPIVSLVNPENGDQVQAGTLTTFTYNVTDSSPIKNCSLFIDNIINITNTTVTRNIDQNFTLNLTNNTYQWKVSCYDIYDNQGNSSTYSLTVSGETAPIIDTITIQSEIDLNAGSTVEVLCNASISDNNVSGLKINATLFDFSQGKDKQDDNNDHYTLLGCTNTSSAAQLNISCGFDVWYYANNGTWTCDIAATDQTNLTGLEQVNTTVNTLLAIDLTPGEIDYGSLQAGENSTSPVSINITNLGNIDFNVTVDGYGQSDGDGNAMNCSNRNISIEREKYSIEQSIPYGSASILSDIAATINNFIIYQKTDDIQITNEKNATYWYMGIPYGTQGSCQGYVNFKGVAR